MKNSLDKIYLEICSTVAKLSKANKLKVGAIIVRDGRILSDGVNGTPYGLSNVCEDENNTTLPQVIHAELNALLKLSRSSDDCRGATMYINYSPCLSCAAHIIQSGIAEVVYQHDYRCQKGLELLSQAGIKTTKL